MVMTLALAVMFVDDTPVTTIDLFLIDDYVAVHEFMIEASEALCVTLTRLEGR